jgi:hypothetical protein
VQLVLEPALEFSEVRKTSGVGEATGVSVAVGVVVGVLNPGSIAGAGEVFIVKKIAATATKITNVKKTTLLLMAHLPAFQYI